MDIFLILYNDLKKIRTYLIKIGRSRRTGKVLESKLNEVEIIHQQYESNLLEFKEKVTKKYFSNEDILLTESYCRQFIRLYEDILLLCKSDSSQTGTKMNSFDLKTALSLLPIMTNDESNTKQLIDNILYYDSLLTEEVCKQNLINFVLKSRLSQEAKLRLKSKYETVRELINDMRNVLLSKKGATAISDKLNRIRQNDLSIIDYGKEITDLFVSLTVSQASGDDQAYTVLKPINEKTAIKRFTDGLRNRRLSTILTARKYDSLKDAIQDAQDEEVSSTTTSGEIMGMYKKSFYNSHNRNGSTSYRGYRGQRNYSFASRGRARTQENWTPPKVRGQWYRRGNNGSRPQQRGNFYRSSRGNQRIRDERNINTMNFNTNNDTHSDMTENKFFRD